MSKVSFTHSFIHPSLIYSFICSSTPSLSSSKIICEQGFNHSFIRVFIHLSVHHLPHSLDSELSIGNASTFIHLFIHSSIISPSLSLSRHTSEQGFIHSFTYLFIHLFIHSFTFSIQNHPRARFHRQRDVLLSWPHTAKPGTSPDWPYRWHAYHWHSFSTGGTKGEKKGAGLGWKGEKSGMGIQDEALVWGGSWSRVQALSGILGNIITRDIHFSS